MPELVPYYILNVFVLSLSAENNFNFIGLCNTGFNLSKIWIEQSCDFCQPSLLVKVKSRSRHQISFSKSILYLKDPKWFQHSFISNGVREGITSKIDWNLELEGYHLGLTYISQLANQMLSSGNRDLTSDHILQIHKRVLGSIHPQKAGMYTVINFQPL